MSLHKIVVRDESFGQLQYDLSKDEFSAAVQRNETLYQTVP
jgi:hypothetical protein